MVSGVVPDCVSCGPCFSNWTGLVDELVAKTNTENLRFRSVVEQHYGLLTIEQLTNNVTLLRAFLMTVLGNLDANTTALADKLTMLQTRLSTMMVSESLFFVFF